MSEEQVQEPAADTAAPANPGWEPAISELREQLAGLTKQINGELGKLRRKLAPEGAEPPAKPAAEPSDPMLPFRLGQALSGLPQKAQAKLQAMIEDGQPLEQVYSSAQILLESLGEGDPDSAKKSGGGDPGQGVGPGKAEIAAPQKTPPLPRTYAEAVEWSKKRPDDWARAKPHVDFTQLPMY